MNVFLSLIIACKTQSDCVDFLKHLSVKKIVSKMADRLRNIFLTEDILVYMNFGDISKHFRVA